MRKLTVLFFIFISISASVFGKNRIVKNQADSASEAVFYSDVSRWFNAWRLVSEDIFKMNAAKPVEFVFFDDQYVYSTSSVTIPDGEIVKGPGFLGKKLIWKKALHKNSIKLPSNETVPVGLMSFAGELQDGKSNAFFIMPLSTFWKKSGVESRELGLENLITGVFLHEFSHSQQMENFGRKITEYEKATSFGVNFSDDIVQDIFGKNQSYAEQFRQETETFYEAAATKEPAAKDALLKKGLTLLKSRHSQYFTGNYSSISEIDNFFLTMEGLGQFAMYAWLSHPKGGNIAVEKVIPGVRRGKNQWSQDEGFALFLLLNSYEKPEKWAKGFFGKEATSIVDLLKTKQSLR